MFELLRKRLFKTNKSKGFTLTELIVVVALIAILMTCVMAFAQPIRKLLKGSTAKSDALTINEILGTFVERKLAYAHKVDVFGGYTYDPSDMNLINAFKGVRDYKISDPSNKNSPGMFVFHFEPDTTDPLKSTFKLYDVNIENASATIPALTDDYLAFKDDFYGDYEFMVTLEDTTVQLNNQKKRAYLNLKIQAFNFEGEYTLGGMTAATIADYYNYKDDSSLNDPTYAYINERIGVENVSFTLENVKIRTESTLNDNGTPTDDTDDYYELKSKMSNGNSLTMKRGNDLGVYGTDVIIFYNVRTYDIADWKLHH